MTRDECWECADACEECAIMLRERAKTQESEVWQRVTVRRAQTLDRCVELFREMANANHA